MDRTNLGSNVVVSVEKNILTVTIDLSKPGSPSSTGKSDVVASTRGNQIVPGTNFRLGVNVYAMK